MTRVADWIESEGHIERWARVLTRRHQTADIDQVTMHAQHVVLTTKVPRGMNHDDVITLLFDGVRRRVEEVYGSPHPSMTVVGQIVDYHRQRIRCQHAPRMWEA